MELLKRGLKSVKMLRRIARKWRLVLASLVALVIADGAWEYLEARQLDQTMAAWMSAPTRHMSGADRASDPSRNAAPSYGVVEDFARQDRAHKNAAGAPESEIFAIERELSRSKDGAVPPATIARAAAFVDLHADVYRALDRARELDFRGLTADSFHQSLFWPIRSHAALRTHYLALTGRGDAAAASLLAELGLDGIERRPMAGGDLVTLRSVLADYRQDTVADVQLVLARTAPAPDALAALAAALAAADEDGQLARSFAAADDMAVPGALYLTDPGDRTMTAYQEYLGTHAHGANAAAPSAHRRFLDAVTRPLVLRDLRVALRQRLAVLEAASRPWPERFDAVESAIRPVRTLRRSLGPWSKALYPTSGGWIGQGGWNEKELALSAANQAHLRAARVAVAIERYRRDHEDALPERFHQLVPAYLDALPADPFTGTPLQFKATNAGYVVYSVGQNRSDDGGAEAGTPPITKPGKPRMTGDIGVRVDVRR